MPEKVTGFSESENETAKTDHVLFFSDPINKQFSHLSASKTGVQAARAPSGLPS